MKKRLVYNLGIGCNTITKNGMFQFFVIIVGGKQQRQNYTDISKRCIVQDIPKTPAKLNNFNKHLRNPSFQAAKRLLSLKRQDNTIAMSHDQTVEKVITELRDKIKELEDKAP